MQTGGLIYDVPAGRRDGRISLSSETSNLPPPTFNVDQLTQLFVKKGFTQEEMVTLSGKNIPYSNCTSPLNYTAFHTLAYNVNCFAFWAGCLTQERTQLADPIAVLSVTGCTTSMDNRVRTQVWIPHMHLG